MGLKFLEFGHVLKFKFNLLFSDIIEKKKRESEKERRVEEPRYYREFEIRNHKTPVLLTDSRSKWQLVKELENDFSK